MNALAHSLDRSIVIRARVPVVFRYFTDSARFAEWWGKGSTIEARKGGAMYIRHPNGVVVRGEVLEVEPDRRIAFTYGYETDNPMVPPGGSRVTITLEPHARGTLVRLHHEFASETARDHHVQGWRYQLSLFSGAVSREAQADAAGVVDAWLAAWSEKDEARRRAAIAAIAADGVEFRDAFSATSGRDDLVAHIGAAQMFMPGMTLKRHGEPRACQGTVLADWTAAGPDGAPRGRGTNAFDFDADGMVERVVGFWAQG
jgi:uncharacterized protein YndB with AHSA1/START domain